MGSERHEAGAVAGETDSPAAGLFAKDLKRFLQELSGLAHDHLELITLEARLSVNTLLRMIVVCIVSALVLVSAWLALLGSAAFGLISIGLPLTLVLLCVAAANFVIAILGWLWLRRMSDWLGWPATQRALKPTPATDDDRGGR